MIPNALAPLVGYGERLLPGLVLFAAALLLVPSRATGARIALYIGLFVLIRDAMTPAGLWRIDGALRLGFYPEPLVLLALAAMSLAAVGFLVIAEGGLRPLLVWRRGSVLAGAGIGIAAGAAIAAPVLWITGGAGLDKFGGPPAFLLALLALALAGNCLEEVLFRGYLQSRLGRYLSPLRAALASGVVFAACHSYLAITVTGAGWPILAFTLVEGVVCGLVAIRHGLVGATLAHATAIFLIAGPML